jgi:hypothetical protein
VVFTIAQEKLQEAVDGLQRLTNTEVPDGIAALATLVKENEGNSLTEEFGNRCKSMQTDYNEKEVPSVKALMAEYSMLDEMRDVIAKAAANLTAAKAIGVDAAVASIEMPEI